MSGSDSFELGVAPVINSTETEQTDKEHNITVYSAALEKIINKKTPTLTEIREALIPTKNGKILKVKVGNEWKDLKGFDRIKTSFAKRSWAKMDKQLTKLEKAHQDRTNKSKKYAEELWNTELMFEKISKDAEKHKTSMMNNPKVYEQLYSNDSNCIAEKVLMCFEKKRESTTKSSLSRKEYIKNLPESAENATV